MVTDIFDPRQNIFGGVRYLRVLANLFNGDIQLTIAAYNAGQTNVDRWVREAGGADEFDSSRHIPFPETQNYVKRILGTAEDYRMLYGRDGGRPRSASSIPR